MKISDHITHAEAIHSNTAKRRGIDNTPNQTQVEAMKLLAEKVFEPLILMMYMVGKVMQICINGLKKI